MSEKKEKITTEATKKDKNNAPAKKKSVDFKAIGEKVKKFFKDFKGEWKKVTWPSGKTVLNHSLVVIVVVLVFAGDDVFPPLPVFQIPGNGLLDAVGKLGLRQPAQLGMDLGGVDGIAHIVALPVCHIGDQALRLAQGLANDLDDVDILHLVVAADVVDLAHTALVDDQIDGLAVIFHIKPVTYLQALSVNREFLIIKCMKNYQRNKFFREMIRAVIIGTISNNSRQSESAFPCPYEVVT